MSLGTSRASKRRKPGYNIHAQSVPKLGTRVGALLRDINKATTQAEKLIAEGRCGDALDYLTFAFKLKGQAEGYVRAQREAKGKAGRWDDLIFPGDREVFPNDKRITRLSVARSHAVAACNRLVGSKPKAKRRRPAK